MLFLLPKWYQMLMILNFADKLSRLGVHAKGGQSVINLVRGVAACCMFLVSTEDVSSSDLFSEYQDLNKSILGKTLYFNCYSSDDQTKDYPTSYKVEKKLLGKKTLARLSPDGNWETQEGVFGDTLFSSENAYPMSDISSNTLFKSLNFSSKNQSKGGKFDFVFNEDGKLILSYRSLREGLKGKILSAKWLAKQYGYIPNTCELSFEQLFNFVGKCSTKSVISFIKGSRRVETHCTSIIYLVDNQCRGKLSGMRYGSLVIDASDFDNPDFPANYIYTKKETLGKPKGKQMHFISADDSIYYGSKCEKVGN